MNTLTEYPEIPAEEATLESNLEPLADRVVLRVKEEPNKSKGGIILPGAAKQAPQEGEVLAVGPGIHFDNGELKPMHLKVGDTVVFAKFAGIEVEREKEKLLVVSERDIVAVMKK